MSSPPGSVSKGSDDVDDGGDSYNTPEKKENLSDTEEGKINTQQEQETPIRGNNSGGLSSILGGNESDHSGIQNLPFYASSDHSLSSHSSIHTPPPVSRDIQSRRSVKFAKTDMLNTSTHSRGSRHKPHRSPSVTRITNVPDMETGIEGGRALQAMIRSERSSMPQRKSERIRRGIRKSILGRFWEDDVADSLSPSSPFKSSLAESLQVPDIDHPTGGLSIHDQVKATTKSAIEEDEDVTQNVEIQRERQASSVQYRLQSVRTNGKNTPLLKWFALSQANVSIYEEPNGKSCLCFGIAPNALVMKYLHWAFRGSFISVFLSASVLFLILTILFAIPIYGIARRHPTCMGGVLPDDDTYAGPESGTFMDAWELSWTTFTTVGYGLVYSGISSTEPNVHECAGITMIVTIEAFVGVLFASMCGAVVFAKVSRVQSYAQITFSDPIVIRYGSGVTVDEATAQADKIDNASSDEGSADSNEVQCNRHPCPVLEFRINNRMHSIIGGEVIDASLNIVASIDARQASPSLRRATTRRRKKKKGLRRRYHGLRNGKAFDHAGGTAFGALLKAKSRRSLIAELTKDDEVPHVVSSGSLPSLAQGGYTLEERNTTYQAVDEDLASSLVPRKIFSKLETESPEHPFFKRVWLVQHILNEHSPLLRSEVRLLIRENDGFWPEQLNNPDGVRAAVMFDQMLVSMSGTSNADANSVYAQKVYDFSDVNVGYRFVNQLYRDEDDGSLRVDTRLINDVQEQAGGGGEPLSADKDGNARTDMWVL